MHINKHTHTHIIYRGGVKETLTAMGSCTCMRRLDGGRDGSGGGIESDRLQGGSVSDASEVAGGSPER